MAVLTEDVKRYIVERLACYDTPTQVVEAVAEAFGVTVERNQVYLYDAERAGRKPSAKWCAVFAEARKRFLEAAGEIPIAHKAVRLRRLDRMATRAETKGNLPLAAQLLEQAAKEVGGFFTNRRELTGAGGGAIATKEAGASLDDLTETELLALAARLAGVRDGDGAAAPDAGPET